MSLGPHRRRPRVRDEEKLVGQGCHLLSNGVEVVHDDDVKIDRDFPFVWPLITKPFGRQVAIVLDLTRGMNHVGFNPSFLHPSRC